MPDIDCFKSRIIHLRNAQETEQAVKILQENGYCAIALPPRPQIIIAYQLPEQLLTDIVVLLTKNDCPPDSNAWQHWRLTLIEYSETIQLHNMAEPPPISQAREAFIQRYQHHKHGDSDDTPEELRYDR